jgi:hypothetical protein
MSPNERSIVAEALSIPHVPVIHAAFNLASLEGMADILAFADGYSTLNPKTLREGLVFKAIGRKESFKAISNKYLLKQKN